MPFELSQAQIEELIPTLGRPDPKNQFEAELIETHRHYVRKGKALVLKQAVPMVAMGRRQKTGGGRWRGTYAIQTCPTVADYWGVLSDGMVVAMDAKERDASSSRGFRFAHSDARSHQWLALRLLEGWGAAAFFIVSVVEGGKAGWAALVKPSWIGERQSVDLQECPVIERGDGGLWDWLSEARRYGSWTIMMKRQKWSKKGDLPSCVKLA